jgi:hypothetical protein
MQSTHETPWRYLLLAAVAGIGVYALIGSVLGLPELVAFVLGILVLGFVAYHYAVPLPPEVMERRRQRLDAVRESSPVRWAMRHLDVVRPFLYVVVLLVAVFFGSGWAAIVDDSFGKPWTTAAGVAVGLFVAALGFRRVRALGDGTSRAGG